MKNFCSPHVHPASFDSGSTIKTMVDREIELGTGHAAITDHGTLGSCIEWYEQCQAKGITPILGLEAFFRDDDCPILDKAGLVQPLISGRKKEITKERSTFDYLKYYHLTMHFLDQAAYLAGAKLLSHADLHNSERHGSELKPLFVWRDIEELGSYNITMGSGCLVGMVQRHLLANRPDLAEQYYLKLRSLVKPGNFYVEIFPHDCSQEWENKISITLEGGEEIKLNEGRSVLVDGERTKVKDLLRRRNVSEGKLVLDGTFYYSDLTEIKKPIVNVELKKGFFRNECTAWAPDGDVQKSANRFLINLATKYGDPILISDDAHYAHKSEKLVQDARLGNGKEDWKFWGTYNRMDTEEAGRHLLSTLPISATTLSEWVDNSYEWAERFKDFKLQFDLQLPTRFYEEHGDSLAYVRKLIKKHGRLDPSNPAQLQRLAAEIKMLKDNGTINLLPYFFPLEEVVDAYQNNGLLTGPGRGSAAGMLLTYLLGITHVDPLRYKLSKERFITEDRIQAGTLPDIDQDLEDREFLVGPDGHSGWLHQRFGSDYVAQISTNTNLRLKSSIKDVHRAKGTLTDEVEKICKRLPNPPQGIEDIDFIFGKKDQDGVVSAEVPGILDNPALKEYIERFPNEWEVVQKMVGIPRQKSRHACAYVIANSPIVDFIPMTNIGKVPVTQYTAKSVEKCGGVKIDFLTLNSLKDIRICLDLIRSRSVVAQPESTTLDGRRVPKIRLLPFNGRLYDIWDLPEDQAVFKEICQGRTETVFQLNTHSATQYLKLFNRTDSDQPIHLIRSIEDIAAFTALDRPGPLDYEVGNGKNMLHEFVARKKGDIDRQSSAYSPYLFDTLPETMGVLVFQEQLQRVVQDLGGFTPLEANEFRICVGKKKKVDLINMRPKFMAGATPRVGEAEAEQIWNMMVTFGQYGFNLSHAISYSVTAYACAFLKHHYPLEWWCAVLQNADKDEIYGTFWRHCRHLVLPPDINQSKNVFTIEGDKIRSPIGLMDGVGPAIRDELVSNAPYVDVRDILTRVNRRIVNRRVMLKLLVSGVLDSLFAGLVQTESQFEQYMQARQDLLDEAPAPLPERLRGLQPLQRFCVRKDIVPTYMCGQSPGEKTFLETFLGFVNQANAMAEVYGIHYVKDNYGNKYLKVQRRYDHDYKLLGPKSFENTVNDNEKVGDFAIPAYVVEENRFSYADGTKEALKLTVDFDGVVVQMVMWPRRTSSDPDAPKATPWQSTRKLEGSVVLLCLSRFQPGRDLSIDDIRFVCGIPEEIEKVPATKDEL